MPSEFFRVSSTWMKSCGLGDEAQVFKVIRTESDKNGQPEYDILYLERGGFDWPVFRDRGRLVPPYTLLLTRGKFYPALADAEEMIGLIKVSAAEYHTMEEVQAACDELNAALAVIRAHNVEN